MCRLRGRRIAMVFQEPMTALDPLQPLWRTVSEPLRVHRGLDARAARAEAMRLLDRVMIATALACGPELLIADEPTTALDTTLQREILALIGTLVADGGMALLLISHDLDLMARSVERVMVMYGGVVVEDGPGAQVLAAPAHPYTRGLVGARPRLGAPRGTRLATIPGRVPALGEWPAGCPFADRCGWVVEACRSGMPAPMPVGPDHTARCIRLDAVSDTPSTAAATARSAETASSPAAATAASR